MRCVSGYGQPPNICPLLTSELSLALSRALSLSLSLVGGRLSPREEVSVKGAEIQNFKAEIIGNESVDLCFLF